MKAENENIDMSIMLLRYIYSEATDDDIVQIENWLKADKSNLLYLQKLRKENELAKASIHSIDFNSNSAYSKFEEIITLKKRKTITKKIYVSIASIAALFILIIGVPYFLSNNKTIKSAKNIEHFALIDSISEIILPDSSQVFLNSGSKLTYTDRYNKQSRDVSISGEAFLNVTHDTRKPFIVHIEGVQIQVKGTSFSVYHDSTNQKIIVTVKTGKVLVSSKNDTLLITKSEQASINLQNQQILKTTTDILHSDAWLTGILEFNNTPLFEVIESLNKNFKTNIVIASSNIEKKSVYATFYKNDDIEIILKTLQLGLSVDIKKENGKFVLYETNKD